MALTLATFKQKHKLAKAKRREKNIFETFFYLIKEK